MTPMRSHSLKPPAWLAIAGISHARGKAHKCLCGASIPPNATTGKGLPRCASCKAMRSNAAQSGRTKSCRCGLITTAHDPARCAKIRRNLREIEGRPPEASTRRGNDHREWASGTGSGYGEWYPMPFSGQVRARIQEY